MFIFTGFSCAWLTQKTRVKILLDVCVTMRSRSTLQLLDPAISRDILKATQTDGYGRSDKFLWNEHFLAVTWNAFEKRGLICKRHTSRPLCRTRRYFYHFYNHCKKIFHLLRYLLTRKDNPLDISVWTLRRHHAILCSQYNSTYRSSNRKIGAKTSVHHFPRLSFNFWYGWKVFWLIASHRNN